MGLVRPRPTALQGSAVGLVASRRKFLSGVRFRIFFPEAPEIELGGPFLLLDADLDAVQLQLQVRRLCTVSETCRSQAEPVLQREGGVSSGSRAQTALEKPGGFILLGCFLTNCSNFAVPKTEPVSRSRNRGRFPALSKLYAPEEVF